MITRRTHGGGVMGRRSCVSLLVTRMGVEQGEAGSPYHQSRTYAHAEVAVLHRDYTRVLAEEVRTSRPDLDRNEPVLSARPFFNFGE